MGDKSLPSKSRTAKHELLTAGVMAAVFLAVYFVVQQWPVRDFWSGLFYQPNDRTQEIGAELELTKTGERILAATRPTVEASTTFNDHCDSHKDGVSLLGCYTEGKIYVYEITKPELIDSNKVTMAHELLHAAWARMSNSEKKAVGKLLEQVEAENREWFETELASYAEEERLEEIWTRAGTKLAELPEELEKYYAKYFKNRQKIVKFYENYQAPFRKLQDENQKLQETILQVKAEIARERAEYLANEAQLETRIEEFNQCANRAGCFRNAEEFQAEREAIMEAQEVLESERIQLNAKIDENNARVEVFQENQIALGELNDAMNSNAEERQE